MKFYKHKEDTYFLNSRYDLIHFLPSDKKGLRVLEVGAGGGSTLYDLKKRGIASEVVGIELFTLPNTLQNHPAIDQFIIGNIEEIELNFSSDYFDAILFGDVLEHLLDPWNVIEKLYSHLKIGGQFIASIPNIRSGQAFKNIFIKGDFKQENRGLFDKTHYRWFCKKNMIELLTSDSLQLVSVTSNLEFKKRSGTRIFNRLTQRLFEEFLTVQFIVVTKRVN